MDLLKQEPLVPVTLEVFFPMGFFEKVTINMTSCSEIKKRKMRGVTDKRTLQE